MSQPNLCLWHLIFSCFNPEKAGMNFRSGIFFFWVIPFLLRSCHNVTLWVEIGLPLHLVLKVDHLVEHLQRHLTSPAKNLLWAKQWCWQYWGWHRKSRHTYYSCRQDPQAPMTTLGLSSNTGTISMAAAHSMGGQSEHLLSCCKLVICCLFPARLINICYPFLDSEGSSIIKAYSNQFPKQRWSE